MRNKFFLFFMAFGLSSGQVPLKIFLLAGQSNMSGYTPTSEMPSNLTQDQPNVLIYADGELAVANKKKWLRNGLGFGSGLGWFGPEITFGKTLMASAPGTKFGLIKYSRGGTALATRWCPPGSRNQLGDLYKNFMSVIDSALAAIDTRKYRPEIVGFLWMQGENDALDSTYADQYQANLENFISDIRAKVSIPDMPFIIGKIDSTMYWTYAGAVRAAETHVARNGKNIGIFDTHGYPTDGYHYTLDGMIQLGEDFAKTYLSAYKSAVTPGLAADKTSKFSPLAKTSFDSGPNPILSSHPASKEITLEPEFFDLTGRRAFRPQSANSGSKVHFRVLAFPK